MTKKEFREVKQGDYIQRGLRGPLLKVLSGHRQMMTGDEYIIVETARKQKRYIWIESAHNYCGT